MVWTLGGVSMMCVAGGSQYGVHRDFSPKGGAVIVTVTEEQERRYRGCMAGSGRPSFPSHFDSI